MKLRTLVPFYIALSLAAVLVALLLTLSLTGLNFTKNFTVSAPKGLYLLTEPHTIKRSDLVLFPLPKSLTSFAEHTSWLKSDRALLKLVGALAGDRVCRKENRLSINGRFIALASDRDSDGNTLPKWNGCFRVKRGHFLPLSTFSPNSFDGRYFGQVPLSAVQNKAFPILTF